MSDGGGGSDYPKNGPKRGSSDLKNGPGATAPVGMEDGPHMNALDSNMPLTGMSVQMSSETSGQVQKGYKGSQYRK